MMEDAIRLARAFHAYGVWRNAPFDEDAVRATFAQMMDGDRAYLEATPSGLVGGVLVPLWFSPSVIIAAELFWYAEAPGEGRRLRQRFEAWAREMGADHIQFSAMADEKQNVLTRLFSRSGYELCELGFRRAV